MVDAEVSKPESAASMETATMGRYNVTIGKEFEVEAVDVDGDELLIKAATAAVHVKDAQTRRVLAFAIVAAIAVALVVATTIGWHSGSFDAANAVWNAAAVPLGYVLATFFNRNP